MYLNLEHKPTLPYAYFDAAKGVMVLRLMSSADAEKIDVFYGDPFNHEKSAPPENWHWIYSTAPMEILYETNGKRVWQCEIEPPKTRRLKYGFLITVPGSQTPSLIYFSEKCTEPFAPALLNEAHHHFFFPFIHVVDAPKEPEWVSKTIWYQIFPDRFFNGDKTNDPPNVSDWNKDSPAYNSHFGGDIEGIIQKLPYLSELGVSGIFLNPVFTSPSNHKYDTGDYYTVDPHFGSKETLKRLVSAAHERKMRVMLDGVFNHIGHTNEIWQDVLKNQEKSLYKDWFHIHKWPVSEKWPGDRHKLGYDTFAFTEKMPKWNTENPAAREYLINAAVFWIKECDIDGWRLDVSDEVSLDFWYNFCAACRKTKSSFYIIGEMWHDASPWLLPPYFNAAMNYPLGFAIRDFFLCKIIDAETFGERLVNALSRYSSLHNRIAFNLLDSHDTERALHLAGGDKIALENAFTFLLCMPGSPCIYYGTEVGLSGGRDPDCRRPMLWDDEKLNKISKIDKNLLTFFKNSVIFRYEHLDIIQNGRLTYTRKVISESNNDIKVHIWTITGKSAAISLVYDGTSSIKIESAEL